jgi:hypothetical protein
VLEDVDDYEVIVLLGFVGIADTLIRETAHDGRRDLRKKMFMASKCIITRVVCW